VIAPVFSGRPFKDSALEKAYMADEIRDMIAFLEAQSGKRWIMTVE
jgi:hypothetical protein